MKRTMDTDAAEARDRERKMHAATFMKNSTFQEIQLKRKCSYVTVIIVIKKSFSTFIDLYSFSEPTRFMRS